MRLVIDIPKQIYLNAKADMLCGADVLVSAIKNGTPLPKGHGDLIDRSKLDVTPIDITDLPIDRCLLVYMAEDVDNAPALVCADKQDRKE